MPDLTIDTSNAPPKPATAASGAVTAGATTATEITGPPPVDPQTSSQTPGANPQPQLKSQSQSQSQSPPPLPPPRSTSPDRPPVSPITPTLPTATLPPVASASASATTLPGPAFRASAATRVPQEATPSASAATPDFAATRQAFTYTQAVPDAAASAISPPRPEAIDFEANPDVLALKSAISILQLQRQRAVNDIRSLGAVKDAAAQNPEAFLQDLQAGSVKGQGDPLFPPSGGGGGGAAAGDADSDSDSDSDSGSDSDSNAQDAAGHGGGDTDGQGAGPDGSTTTDKDKDKDKDEGKGKTKTKTKDKKSKRQKQPWTDLPRPQNVVRCPPINWSQYAVAGDSLDRLHADQVARPSQGQPAIMGPGGTFEFQAGANGDGNRREFVGVAAPYAPGRDKLDKKPTKGGKR